MRYRPDRRMPSKCSCLCAVSVLRVRGWKSCVCLDLTFSDASHQWSPRVPSAHEPEVGPFRMAIPLSQQATSDGSTQKIPARAFTTERQVAVIDDSASDDGIELDVGYAMAGWPRCSTMPQSTSHTTSTQLLSTTSQVQLVAVQCRSLPLVPGRPRLLRLASPVFLFLQQLLSRGSEDA
jgi:hypothetical protein